MTDKEMLILAAEAFGLTYWCYIEDDEYYGSGILYTDENDCNRIWNPLTSMDDAIELAVKLGMIIDTNVPGVVQFDDLEKFCSATVWNENRTAYTRCAAKYSGYDPTHAIQIAITRLAAKVRRKMLTNQSKSNTITTSN